MGPSGLGAVAQFINFHQLTSTIILMGLPVGLTTKVSEIYSDKNENYVATINAYWSYFLKIVSFTSLIITVCLLTFSGPISNFLIGDYGHRLIFSVIIVSIPFSCVYAIVDSFLKSFGDIPIIVKIGIYSASLSTVLLIPLLIHFDVVGAAIGIFLLYAIPALMFYTFFKGKYKDLFKVDRIKNLLSSKEKISIVKIGLVSLVSGFMHQGALIIVRKIILSNFGEVETGIYQSVLGISINYFVIIYTFLSSYTLPRLSTIKDNEQIRNELNETLRFLYSFIIPSVLLIFCFRDVILKIVYSSEFLSAGNLFLFQLIGDIFKMMGALMGLWLIPRMKIKPLIIIDFIFNLIFIFLPFVLLKFFIVELYIIPFSYMIAFFVHFILLFSYTKYSLGFKITLQNKKIIFLSAFFLLSAFTISINFSVYGYYYAIIVVIIWFYMVFSGEEKRVILSKALRFFKK